MRRSNFRILSGCLLALLAFAPAEGQTAEDSAAVAGKAVAWIFRDSGARDAVLDPDLRPAHRLAATPEHRPRSASQALSLSKASELRLATADERILCGTRCESLLAGLVVLAAGDPLFEESHATVPVTRMITSRTNGSVSVHMGYYLVFVERVNGEWTVVKEQTRTATGGRISH